MAKNEQKKGTISLKDYTFQSGKDLKHELSKVRRCICDMMGELAVNQTGSCMMPEISQSLFTLNHLIDDVDFVESKYDK